MAVRKRARPVKAPASTGVRSRVQRVASIEQWDELNNKAGDRLVVIQFFQASVYVCAQMRPYFNRMSAEQRFRRVVFAEADVDEAEELATKLGVQRVPTYQVYYEGELKESFSGGQPGRVNEMVRAALAAHARRGGGLAQRLLLAAGVAATGALGFLAWRFMGGSSSSGGGGDAAAIAEELRRLRGTINAAQSKLSAMEMSKSAKAAKAARAQRKMLSGLEAQRAVLERNLRRVESAAAQRTSNRAGRSEAGGSLRRPAVEAAAYSEDEDELEDRADAVAVGDAVYSDEEED